MISLNFSQDVNCYITEECSYLDKLSLIQLRTPFPLIHHLQYPVLYIFSRLFIIGTCLPRPVLPAFPWMVCYYWSVDQEERCWQILGGGINLLLEYKTEFSAFSSPREKIQILIGVVSHAYRSRMFRKIWHFKILECTDPDVIISNLEGPFLLNQCPYLSVADVLGLRI